MANLKEIKGRITSISSTQQITKAMKMVSAAKLRKAQDRILQLRPYAGKLSEVLQNVSASLGTDTANPYAEEREIKRVLIVPITSDRGLCGGFNANVAKATVQLIKEKYAAKQVEILPIGTKGRDFFKRREYTVIAEYADLFTRLSFEDVRVAAEFVIESFLRKEYDAVELVYNEFKNVVTQVVCTEQLLPLAASAVEQEASESKAVANDYIFEPEKEEIISLIIPKSLKITFYKAILESNASEHGARMTAMSKATDNAGELLKELRLTYNRTRQAAITTEILEIVAGAEALSNG